MKKRVGEILREARESKKLSIQDISRETNISIKYITALETENYNKFPGSVFIKGFLKTYSNFLKLDTSHLIYLYDREQVDESEVPIKELVQSTKKEPFIKLNKNFFLFFISIFFLSVSFYLIYDILLKKNLNLLTFFNKENISILNTKEKPKKNALLNSIIFQNHFSKPNKKEYFILSKNQGINLYIENKSYKIFFASFEHNNVEKLAKIGFSCCNQNSVYYFRLKKNEAKSINSSNSNFSSLAYNFNFLLNAVTEISIKVILDIKKHSYQKENIKANKKNEIIQIFLYFKKSSYVEFIIDGKNLYRGIIRKNERRMLEANERLEIKIGDGSAVEMIQNENRKTTLGPPGKLIRKVFLKVPDPYDSTKFIIKEE